MRNLPIREDVKHAISLLACVFVISLAFILCSSASADNERGIAGEDIEPLSPQSVLLLTNDDENDSKEEMTNAGTFILNGDEDVARVDVAVSDAEKTIIDIDVKGVKVEETEEDGEVFQILTIAGYATTTEVGKPQLPAIRDLVAIPDGASVKATVLDASYKTYSGYNVYPFQMPQVDSENASQNTSFVIDREFYSQDSLYPEELVIIGTPGIWRDLSVANLQINPVMFNPAKGELRVYDYVKVELTYEGGMLERKTVKPEFAQMYRSVILNYDFLDVAVGKPELSSESGIVPSSTAYGNSFEFEVSDYPADAGPTYLLLRHEDYVSYDCAHLLLDWRYANGFPWVHVWYNSGASPTSQSIKNLIASFYSSYPSLEYVVIVGDISYLPWYGDWSASLTFQTMNRDATLPSDYWFGCLSGDDLYPELAVGRLSVNNDAEAQQQISKILAYEQNPPAGTWTDKALLIAHREGAPGKYEGCKEDIRTTTYSDPFAFDTLYGSSGATNANIKSAIDNGRGIVNYRGHGSETEWWQWNTLYQSYTTTDAQALNNGDKTPVVFSIACSCAALDYPTKCLGEAFVKDDDSAVAFLGATRPSWTTPNHDFDMYLFDLVGNYGVCPVGWASNWANIWLINKYGPSSYEMDNVKMYLWLGDPALCVWTLPISDDVAIFRNGVWYVDVNADQVPDSIFWYGGSAGDVPLVGDINRDGTDDIAIFRSGVWFVDVNGDHAPDTVLWYGAAGDVPVVGDINRDGTEDVAIFRNGGWFVDVNGDYTPDTVLWYGAAGDIPIVGDISGDGADDVAIFRNGVWFVDVNGDYTPDTVLWYGAAGDIPIVGDISGDGADDVAIFRNGVWFVDVNGDYTPDTVLWYGAAGDIPIVGDAT